MPITKTLGQRIRQLREAKDLSLRELARKVGVSAAFLSDVELGRRFPSPNLLAETAKALDVTYDELKAYDARPPIEDLKRIATSDPAYGFALRRVVEMAQKGVPAEDLTKVLDRVDQKKKR
jgi:transcriptional regulator with XRE-family HTH domain